VQDAKKQFGMTYNRRAEKQVKAALEAASANPDDQVNFLGDLTQFFFSTWEAAVFSQTTSGEW
jgi:hypothetical protein